jgi:hypothetical protein
MFDDVAVMFYNNVVEAYGEYVAHRDSREAGRDRHLRTAIAASTALYHFREYLPAHLRASVKDLEKTCPDYALMRGVTNASKHKQVTQSRLLVARAEDISEVTVVVRYADEAGEYTHTQTAIHVTCTDGVTRWLDPAITRALNFWGTFLKDNGVFDFAPLPEPDAPGNRYLARSEASTKLDIEAMAGLDLRQKMQVFQFDTDSGRAIPVDLTGKNFQLRIYKPPDHIVNVTMSDPEHGEVTASIPKTDEENVEFHRIKSQSDHEAFMERLFQGHWSEIEEKMQEQLAARQRPEEADEQSPAL